MRPIVRAHSEELSGSGHILEDWDADGHIEERMKKDSKDKMTREVKRILSGEITAMPLPSLGRG